MPTVKYDEIYRELRREIETGVYTKELPAERVLTEKFNCSRNTVRRAVAELEQNGYVQSAHGSGVFILFREPERPERTDFKFSDVESMKEAAERAHLNISTRVVYFTELVTDAETAALTGFPVGEEIYYLRRVRYLDGEALILDHNYFLKSVARGLSPKIAEASIYEYMEKILKEKIVTTQRKYTVELASDLDRKYLNLGDYNCIVMVSGRTFNSKGVQFEYTRSRHRADRFAFYGQVRRRKPEI